MKTPFILIFLSLFVVQNMQAQTEIIPGQYIVTLKESAALPVCLQETTDADREVSAALNETKRSGNLSKVHALQAKIGLSSAAVVAEFADAIVGFVAQLSDDQLARLRADPDVENVGSDYYYALSQPMLESNPGEFELAGQTTPCAITNAGGFANGATKATYIWILDTGIDLDHPDLNVVTGNLAKSFVSGQSVDDGNGHGTHVAGIAGAKNNTFGTVGVSAGAKLVPVKILNNGGGGSWSALLQGLNHVAQYDKVNDVVNLSVGAYPVSNCENSDISLRNAIRNLGLSGTWVCMAAGNESGDAAKSRPGCVNGTKVFTVGAVNCDFNCAIYSNWGATVVDWVTTGTNVYSTYLNGGYATLSGTSMATPVLAGILHARAAAPVVGKNVKCGSPLASYKVAKRI
jgi:subtilisin family serine protease